MDYSILNKTTVEDIEPKRDRILKYLDSKGYDGAVIGRRDNFAWFTSGGENKVLNFNEIGFSYLVIFKDKIQLVSQIMDGQRVIDEELNGLDMEYIPLKWYENSKEDTVLKLTSGKNILAIGMNGKNIIMAEYQDTSLLIQQSECVKTFQSALIKPMTGLLQSLE